MTTQTIVFDSAWLTRNGLVSYQLDCSEENGCADANDLDPARHRPSCFRERLLGRSDPFVQALHVNRLAHSGCRRRSLEADHRIAAGAPGVEAAGQGPHAFDAATSQEQRRPGARGLAGSGAVEHDLPIARDLEMPRLQLLGR